LQADLLSVSRSSLYYQPRPPSAEEVRLKHRIDEVYTQFPFYGSRKIAAQLQREGMSINRKTVSRYMQEMGIAAIYPGPNLSKRNQKEGVYPYLLRHVTSAYPNHIWGIDITYIRLQAGWMYLVAILDWYSRYVVSWELDQTLELPFVLRAVQQALGQAVPLICNSDQGSHFTSPQYCQLLLAANVQISMVVMKMKSEQSARSLSTATSFPESMALEAFVRVRQWYIHGGSFPVFALLPESG
jgi:putative transposase